MDNQNNSNSSTTPNPVPSPTGPFPTPSPTPAQPEPNLTPSQPISEPGPNLPPAAEPTTPPSIEPNQPSSPSPFSSSPWPQNTTLNSPTSGLGDGGLDLNSAWTPPASFAPGPTPPEAIQTPPPPEPVANPWLNPQSPTDSLSSPQPLVWPSPVQDGSTLNPQPEVNTQNAVQPEPDLPLSKPTPAPTESISTPAATDPAPAQPEPTPTFTPPTPDPVDNTSSPTSPFTPPIASTSDNTVGTNPVQPSWMTDNQAPSTSPSPTETAPTDLSHLISNNQQEPASTTPAENLVVPTMGVNPEVPNLPTESHKGIPKWLIGLGIGLLVVVAAASAYFILGIGQSKATTSIPATTQQANQIKPPLPIASSSPQPSPATATGSANFGQIGGTTPATSAADLLRQKQGRQ